MGEIFLPAFSPEVGVETTFDVEEGVARRLLVKAAVSASAGVSGVEAMCSGIVMLMAWSPSGPALSHEMYIIRV
jgi:hypothetical protein